MYKVSYGKYANTIALQCKTSAKGANSCFLAWELALRLPLANRSEVWWLLLHGMVSSDEELTWLESFEEEGRGVTLFEGAFPLELFDLLLVLEFAGLERLDERGMLANYCVVM